MKIFVDEEDIIAGYFETEKHELTKPFLYCLPSDSEGLYQVSPDGETFMEVAEKDLWNYPIVKINYYEESQDRYEGIDDRGIRLLAFDILGANKQEYELKIGIRPSYVVMWRDRTQFIFKLEDPVSPEASEFTWENLDYTTGTVGGFIGGTFTNEMINPFCNEVQSYIFNAHGMLLEDMRKIARVKVPRAQVKEARAKGGRNAAKACEDNTKRKIEDAVRKLKSEGKTINQSTVAKESGLSRQTVNKHRAIIKI